MSKWLRPSLFSVLATLAAVSIALGQEGDVQEDTNTFDRQYIDTDDLKRGAPHLLLEWPQLSDLVRWSRDLETAVVSEDLGRAAELLPEFRVRVDTLAAAAIPEFLVAHEDSVRGVIDSLAAHIVLADTLLAEMPGVLVADSTALNDPTDERTLITGNTAVTVPSGVFVGEADSLPTAEVQGQPMTFVDLISLALSDLDQLVHLTRNAGAPEPTPVPNDGEPNSSPDRAQPPPEP